MRNDLASLLDDRTLEDFLAQDWGKRAVYIPGHEPKLQAIYSPERWAARIADPAYRVTSQSPSGVEEEVSGADAEGLLSRGHTICGDVTEDVAAFLLGFNAQLGMIGRPSASCYVSNHGGGFVTHWDPFHVLVMQIAGSKVWSYSTTPEVAAPRTNFAAIDGRVYVDDDGRIIREPDPARMQTVRLSAGDCLYLPPGTWHRGIADGHSLAVSASPGHQSVTGFVGRVFERLLTPANVRMRLPFPATRADVSGRVPRSMRDELAACLDAIKEATTKLEVDDLEREWALQFERDMASLDQRSPTNADASAMPIARSERLGRALARPLRYVAAQSPREKGIEHLMVYAGTRELVLPTFAEPLIEGINVNDSFIAESALGWDPQNEWSDVASLLGAFVKLGILTRGAEPSPHA